MKTFQKITLTILTVLAMVTQLSATSWEVEVDTPDTSTISSGVSVNTLRKTGGGQLNLTGTGYSVDYIQVEDGHVYVHDAPGLYLRQPVTLGLGRYITHYTQIIVEVATGDSSFIRAPIIAAEVTKQGGGTLEFDCVGSVINYLKIKGGRVIVDASDIIPAIGLYFDGANCILEATTDINLPEVTLSFDGEIKSTKAVTMDSLILGGKVLTTDIIGDTIVNNLDASVSGGTISNADILTLNGATGSNKLTKNGSGLIQVIKDLSGALLPIDVGFGTLQVKSLGKLPSASVLICSYDSNSDGVVDAGSIFQLSASGVSGVPTAGAVPGPMVIQQYAQLSVDAGLAVPADSDAGDVFTGTLQFNSGSVLKLGDGSSWARDMTIGEAL